MGRSLASSRAPPPVQPVAVGPIPVREQVFLAPHRGSDGRFFNPWQEVPRRGLRDVVRWKLRSNPYAAERRDPPHLPVQPDAPLRWDATPPPRLAWLGHASILVEIDGVVALVDPVFGPVARVLRRAVPPPFAVGDLPPIDVVVVTHGHYDHLDRPSLAALARRFDPLFVVPLELGRFIPSDRVVELDWWQAVLVGPVRVALVPAQHWHRRTGLDQDRALWAGVVIEGSVSVYHSGDTGFFEGFRTIGRAFPGLDVAVLPLGAYEPRWFMAPQHMAPEESVAAFRLLGARRMVGMHWGTFDLTDEPLDHGPRVMLPRAIEAHRVDPSRCLVLPHGGVLPLGRSAEPGADGSDRDVQKL